MIERYGAIFLWNGPEPPDHEFPDFLADEGIDEDAIVFEHVRYKVPFPAKWFAENLPDAAHFAGLHRLGSWGDTEVLSESDTKIEYVCHFYGRAPYVGWEDLKRSYRRGEMWGVSDAAGTAPAPARQLGAFRNRYGAVVDFSPVNFGPSFGDMPARIISSTCSWKFCAA